MQLVDCKEIYDFSSAPKTLYGFLKEKLWAVWILNDWKLINSFNGLRKSIGCIHILHATWENLLVFQHLIKQSLRSLTCLCLVTDCTCEEMIIINILLIVKMLEKGSLVINFRERISCVVALHKLYTALRIVENEITIHELKSLEMSYFVLTTLYYSSSRYCR